MDPLVSIPREALAQLLQAAGSPLTPEQYLASLPETGEFKKYGSRTKAAGWSKSILLIAAIVSGLWTCLPLGFGIESVVVTVILAAITFFEFRVYRTFHDRDVHAPSLGFRNQTAFAAFILLYGLYHAFAPVDIPADYREMMDPDLTPMIHTISVVGYLTIGIVGGVSQFGLACFYRSARVPTVERDMI